REKLILRSFVENERFKQIYGTDNLSYANYDLVVDTSYETPENICKLIYDEYESFCACPEKYGRKMYFSPKSLYPTADKDSIAVMNPKSACDIVEVVCAHNYNFIINGHEAVLSALVNKSPFVCATLPTLLDDAQIENKVQASSLEGMQGFERLGGFTYPSYPEV
ncbi:MAG: hypothetical protein IJD67_04365, partial [Clostridia bacterium]|nr:hypothetical protein [Clostridia bacterium]